MNHQLKYCFLLCLFVVVCSCTAQKHIHDISSSNRQEELKARRSGYFFGDVLSASVSIISSTIIGSEVDWQPTGHQFKKLKLVNPTPDTVYVNMLTDIYWDENDYCDFMDIRIPPETNCRILVPLGADYNVYFSNTIQNDDDELIQINTGELKKLKLKPGMTIVIDANEPEK
jgi:hypothetical protein